MAGKSHEDENLTVSKIYETLKSGPFLKKLYWEVLSDIKKRDSFKQMRETTEKLLNKKTETLGNLTDSEEDTHQRKVIVAEICSMTYAIDTVFSKIMYIKLQKEFKSQIIDAIKDLRKEKKIPDSVYYKLQISHDTEAKDSVQGSAGKSISPPAKKPEAPSRPVRTKRLKLTPSQIAAKNHEIRSEIHNDLKAINSNESKIDAPKKNLKSKSQAPKKQVQNKSVKSTPNKSKRNGEEQVPSKSSPSLKKVLTPQNNSYFKTNEEIKLKPEGKMQDEASDSETDSIISVGHVSVGSVTSVSSVHTSDLSSFDDAISLYSEDEDIGIKRKVSLKELEEMCCKSEFSDKCNAMLKSLEELSKRSLPKSDAAKTRRKTEEKSKKNIVPNNRPKIEESPKKNVMASNKQLIEGSSKKNVVTSNRLQIEETSKKDLMTSNKQLTEESSKKNAAVSSKQQIQSSPDEMQDSAGSSTESKSETPKSLPKRIRRPNSKYASENILCPITKIKERKKSSSFIENGKNSSDTTHHSKKRNYSSDSDEEAPSKTIKTVPVEENLAKANLNTPKQPSSPENFKLQFPVRSLTSRKTAPVTLFST